MQRLFAAILFLSAVAIGRAQTCVPIAPDAQDGAIVAPEFHKVIYEDADVRVVDVLNPPHTEEEMHTHVRPSVFIILEEHPHYFYGFAPDGKRTDAQMGHPPYAINLAPNPLHRMINPTDYEDHAVRIEIKHPGCGPAPAALSEQDALKTDAAHTKLVFETDDVRVLEISLAAHDREAPHADAWPAVSYIDQPAQVRDVVTGSAPAPPRVLNIGIIRTGPEALHAMENLSNTPLHLFRVELKHALAATGH